MLGKAIHISSKYLSQKEKVVVVGSKVEALEDNVVNLKKDLIATVDEAKLAKEKAKALANKLKVEKQLTVQKDKQLQAANQKVKSVATKAVQAF